MYYKGIGHVQEAVIFRYNLSSFFKLMNLVFFHKNKATNICKDKKNIICIAKELIGFALLLMLKLNCLKLSLELTTFLTFSICLVN